MTIPLKPVESTDVCATFFDYLDCIDIPEIDYFAIGVQDVAKQRSMTLMSRPEWQKYFIRNEFADADPVRNAVLHSKKAVILMLEIDAGGSLGAEIMLHRRRHGIRNGIVMVSRTAHLNYMVTLGTAYSKFEPYDFLKARYTSLKTLQKDFEKIIEPEAKKFLPTAF